MASIIRNFFESLSSQVQSSSSAANEIQMSNQPSSSHAYSFIPSKSQLSRSSQKYAPSVQGTQGLQAEKPANFKRIFGIPLMITCQLLLLLHFVLFCCDFLPNMYIFSGIYITIIYGIIVFYLYLCLTASYVMTLITPPGYPERIATATGHLKLNFQKQETKGMSNTLKQLLSKRNKGFVALLNSGQPNFPKYQNQCFKCVLKPLKPHRSYHCSTCDRDVIYMDHHCVWVNNCIGLNNYRFFLGFILYLSILMPFLAFPQFIERYQETSSRSAGVTASQQTFWQMLLQGTRMTVYILDLVLMFFMPPYTVWNWRLALHGATQVEHTKKLFRFRDKADKCIEIVGGGTRDRMHGIKGITQDDTIIRSSHIRNRGSKSRRAQQKAAKSSRSNVSTASTNADTEGSALSYSNLNMSDIESDDSFECEDELIIENDEQIEEEDEESIIVAPHQGQTLENVLEMHDHQLAQFIRTYRIQAWRENIFIIFGTWSVLKACVFPLDRQLPLRGLEWSFMTLSNSQMAASNN